MGNKKLNDALDAIGVERKIIISEETREALRTKTAILYLIREFARLQEEFCATKADRINKFMEAAQMLDEAMEKLIFGMMSSNSVMRGDLDVSL